MMETIFVVCLEKKIIFFLFFVSKIKQNKNLSNHYFKKRKKKKKKKKKKKNIQFFSNHHHHVCQTTYSQHHPILSTNNTKNNIFFNSIWSIVYASYRYLDDHQTVHLALHQCTRQLSLNVRVLSRQATLKHCSNFSIVSNVSNVSCVFSLFLATLDRPSVSYWTKRLIFNSKNLFFCMVFCDEWKQTLM